MAGYNRTDRVDTVLGRKLKPKHVQAARRRVIASLQTITMYEYLPAFLGDSLKPYEGYKPDTHPGISHVFQSAAFR